MADLLRRLQQALGTRYRIERELGHGGMGLVFLAEDLKHGRKVALKVLRPGVADSLGGDRFLREIRITAQLNHPNILTLIDSGEADGFTYFVLPYVEGESLRDRLTREKQLSLEDALRITRAVADALSYAHSLGVIHRDVKPENILFEAGHAVVADFGIAKAISDAGREKLTESGLAVGTPAYMSPEQVEGKPPDARSDIYSLGLILYEMFTGECPFRADTPVAAALKRLHEAPPPARTVEPDLPERIDRALQRCLDKDPKKRFQSVAELEAALQRRAPEELAAGEEAPGTALRWGPPWTQKTEVRFLLAAAIFILLLASTWIFSKEGFLMFLLVLAAGVAAVFTWPSWRVLPASIWAGLALGFLTWLVAALVIWKEAPLLMRFAQAGASPTRLTQFMLTVCSFMRIMYPVTALFIQVMALFGRQKEKAEFRRVMSNQLLGLILIVGNVVLAALIVYSVLLLPLL